MHTTIADRGRGPAASAVGPSVGVRLGRFELDRVVGMGAMGVVYESRDPLLGRSVAIKTLRDRPSAEVRTRFAREAAALARVSHPNVVTIFEVHPGSTPYIVMELLEGMTLRDWLGAQARSVGEVLKVMQQVGQGLAAAHGAGLVHRDVKPANVFLESTGRVLLMDFGIARDVTDAWEESGGSQQGITAGSDEKLTEAGTIVGTPAYMAPEQRGGRLADAAADQYAFCMVFYEALFGHRPSTTRDPDARKGLPRDPKVPRWLRRIVGRGLAAMPGDRWPDMDTLLQAIERGRRWQSRRRRILIGAGVAALSAIGAQAAYKADPISTCDARAKEVYRVWNDETRDRVRSNVVARGGHDGERRWNRIAGEFDAYAESWSKARNASCVAGLERHGDIVPGALDRVDECLQGRVDELRRLADTFSNATAEMLARTSSSTSHWLAPVEGCLTPLDPARAHHTATRERDRARVSLDRSLDRERSGDVRGALAASQELVEAAEALGDGDWLSSAYLTRGSFTALVGDLDGSLDDLERAFTASIADGDDEMATYTAAELIEVTGRLGRMDEAMMWEGRARAFLARYGAVGTLAHAEIESRLGNMFRRVGQSNLAIPHLERALEIYGDDLHYPFLLIARARLAAARRDQGEVEEATLQLRGVVRDMEVRKQATHRRAEALLELAKSELAMGEIGRAHAAAWRGLELAEASLGPERPMSLELRELVLVTAPAQGPVGGG